MIFSGSNPAIRPAARRARPVRRRFGAGGDRSIGPAPGRRSASQGFTIVEVMMAATILVVAFMGMIQAITLGSEMMATARRQTLAAQIIEHEIGKLRLQPFATIDGFAAGPTTLTIDTYFAPSIAACGLTTDNSVATNAYIKLERSVADIISGDLCEVTFTVTWQKSGSSSAAPAPEGSWLDQLTFFRPSVIARTYTRKSTAYFGKYGLNLSLQRS